MNFFDMKRHASMVTRHALANFMMCCLILLAGISQPAVASSKEHIVIISGAYDSGMGDFTYGHKTFGYIKKIMPENDYTLILYGGVSEYDKCQRILDFDDKNNADHLWISLETNETSDNVIVSQASKAKFQSQLRHRFAESAPTKVAYIASQELDPEDNDNVLSVLRESGLKPNLVMHNMEYQSVDTQESIQYLADTLSGMDISATKVEDYKNIYWLYEDEDEDEDAENQPDTIEELFEQTFPDHSNYKLYSFGIHKESDIGFMLSDDIARTAKVLNSTSGFLQYATLKSMMTLKDRPWLAVLTGENTFSKQLLWLLRQGDFNFGYMHKPFSLMEYIATTLPLSGNATYVINLPYEDIKSDGSLHSMLLELASQNDIGTIDYWSYSTGSINTVIDAKKSGRLKIINPFALNKKSMEALIALSKSRVVGCTGDHSFYDTISTGKIPFHEKAPHLVGLHHDLSALATQQNLSTVSTYFSTARPDIKRELLSGDQLAKEWDVFREYLWENHNAYKQFEEILFQISPD